MENAGKEDMPDTAERKGLGTPATRAGILEKLASTGFLERKKSKKNGSADALPRRAFPHYGSETLSPVVLQAMDADEFRVIRHIIISRRIPPCNTMRMRVHL